jgi:RNA polymerase sigma factor (sigma-70 family)
MDPDQEWRMREAPGPPSTLPELCAKIEPELTHVLLKYRIPLEDGEDVLQTTLLLALLHWDKIQNSSAWLLGTLENRCILFWRERRRRDQRYEPLNPWDPVLTVAPAQERRAMIVDLETLARELPATQRKVLCLRYHLGMRDAEVAQVAGLAQSSVRGTARRSVTHMQSAIATPGARKTTLQRSRSVALADQLRSEGGAASQWMATVDTFLVSERYTEKTKRAYSRYLAEAGIRLRFLPPAELSGPALTEFRAALLADGWTGTRLRMAFSAVRSFLAWAGTRGDRGLDVGERCVEELLKSTGLRRRVRWKPSSRSVVLPKPCSWTAAVEAFLDHFRGSVHSLARAHLAEGGAVLGRRPLGKLTGAALGAYRARLLADGRDRRLHHQALCVVRTFLLWGRQQRALALGRRVILEALPLPRPTPTSPVKR